MGDRGAIGGEPVQDARADRRSARVLAACAAAFRPPRVPPWGAVGYPSIDLRWRWTRLLRCVAMKTTRLLVLTLVLALCAADRRRLRLVQRERRRRRSRRADPGRRAGLRRGRRAPRRQGPQRPRGRAEEDPAHRRPGREDPAADRRAAARATTSPSRTTSSRGSATASASPSPRCTTAGTPTTRRSSTPRTTARPSNCWPSRRATSSSAPTRASTTASTRKEKTATAIIDHRVVVATEGGLKAVVDAKGKDHLDEANGLAAVRSKVAQDRIGLFYLDVQGLAAHRRAAGEQRPAGRRDAAVVLERGAQDDRRGAAGPARRPARRRGQHRDAASRLDHRRQRRGHPRHAARRLVAGPGRGQPRPDARPRRCRPWPAAAGSPASASTRCSASSRSRRRWTCARTCSAGWATPASSSAGRTSADLGGALVIKTTDPAKTKRTMTVLERFARSRARGTKITSLHGSGIDDGFTAHERDRAGRPGRPRRRPLRGRGRRQGRPGPGDLARPAARLVAGASPPPRASSATACGPRSISTSPR